MFLPFSCFYCLQFLNIGSAYRMLCKFCCCLFVCFVVVCLFTRVYFHCSHRVINQKLDFEFFWWYVLLNFWQRWYSLWLCFPYGSNNNVIKKNSTFHCTNNQFKEMNPYSNGHEIVMFQFYYMTRETLLTTSALLKSFYWLGGPIWQPIRPHIFLFYILIRLLLFSKNI